MPAVTVTSYRTNVDGSYRENFYTINIANSGDTLTTSLHSIKAVNANDTAISKMAVSGGVVTFTSSGATTGSLISVIGI